MAGIEGTSSGGYGSYQHAATTTSQKACSAADGVTMAMEHDYTKKTGGVPIDLPNSTSAMAIRTIEEEDWLRQGLAEDSPLTRGAGTLELTLRHWMGLKLCSYPS